MEKQTSKENSGKESFSGYNVVSGMRRSGTSMLIVALRQSGIPVLGYKWAVNDYPPKPASVKGNKNGFWELGKGVTTELGITKEAKDFGMPGDLMKVMTECLYKSDPEMVDKVVMIFREPGRVIKSLMDRNKIEKIDLFILLQLFQVADSLDWARFNKIPVKMVIYENILKEPLKEIADICRFIGRGDPEEGAKWIEPKLNRSKNKKYKGIKWMQNVYDMAKQGDMDGIIYYKHELMKESVRVYDSYKDKYGKVEGIATPKEA